MHTPQTWHSGLYLITDPQWGHALFDKTEAALKGGLALVQYRNKQASPQQAKAEASALLTLCQHYNTPLLINDNVDLAANINADGVHLGQTDPSCHNARNLLGPNKIIGVTCHDQLDLAVTAKQQGASYVAFGRFFASQTKPGATPANPQLLQQAKHALDLPTVAIGGITLDNACQLLNKGTDLLAVSHSLLSSHDCEQQVRAFNQLFAARPSAVSHRFTEDYL